MGAQSKTIVEAIAITATISLILALILCYIFYRFLMIRRLKKAELDSSFRREEASAVPRIEFRQHGRALKGLIVNEEGLDHVLYLRKLENQNFSGCFSKVWCNPKDEEQVKRINGRDQNPEPIQEVPLLLEQINGYDEPHHLKKPLSLSAAPPSPPSPPPTPLYQPDSSLVTRTPPHPPPRPQSPPPPPPPPLPLLRRGIAKPAQPTSQLKPAPPPPPAKTRGLLNSLHKPPVHPRATENKQSKTEDSDKQSIQENGARTKLKPLHWDKVTANADHSMVWNEINDGSFRFDDDLMEALFGYATTSQKSTDHKISNKLPHKGSFNSLPSSKIFILDPRKSQNTAIVLKSLAISRQEILDSLIDGRGLNSDTLEKLTKICPTKDEITKILHFNGNPTKLADAESFLYHILRAVPTAFIRLNAMLFRSTYDQEILHLKECLQVLELGCNELRSRGVFLKLLEAILKAGNRMNAGTNRGNAKGFNLTALRRLSDVKSTNGKTTLLHFVVEQVVRSEGKRFSIKNSNEDREREEQLMLGLPVVEALDNEFKNVKKAAGLDYESLISLCSILTARVDEIKQMMMSVELGGGFLREMRGFLEDCEVELNVVREEEKRVMELVRKTTVYYQAAGKVGSDQNPLQLFVIVKDFLNNVDQVCSEITKELDKKVKVGRGNGGLSSPPLSPSPRSPVRFQNLDKYFRGGTSSSDSEDDF